MEDKAPVVYPSASMGSQTGKMTQLERLIARITQLIKDSPSQMVTITITVDCNGVPVCWQVNCAQAEGLRSDKNVVK